MRKCCPCLAVSLALVVGLRPASAKAEPMPPPRDIANEVLGVFRAKCAGCHGPDLAKPQGRFGYVLDLRRMAGNPEIVIPDRPAESELYVLVQRDEMPPPDSPTGPLTAAQKEVIREWIAAGAPDAAAPGPPIPEAAADPEPVAVATTARLFRWAGKFHLLALHFPIALVLAAGAAEVWSVWRRNPVPAEVVRFCLCLGAIAAVATVGLGWLFAAGGHGASSPRLLAAHRWLGTAAAVVLVVVAAYAERDARRRVRGRAVRLLLAFAVIVTALAAHFGGLIAHGVEFFAY